MRKKLITQVIAALTICQTCVAQTPTFSIRSADSSLSEFEFYLRQSARTSYTDWILYSTKNHLAKPASLTQALEVSISNPLEALPLFEASIHEIQETWMSESDRSLIASIYQKILDLDLPSRTHEEYLRRYQSFRSLHFPSSNPKSLPPNSNSMFFKEVQLAQEKLKQIKGAEDALILINSEPLAQILKRGIPDGPQQWGLISNAHSPILMTGTWNEFQKRIFQENGLKLLAEGNCQSVRILSGDFEIQTSAQVFTSRECPPENSNRGVGAAPAAQHLSDELPQIEPTAKWKWIVPVVAIVGFGAIYSLKGKHLSIKTPSIH